MSLKIKLSHVIFYVNGLSLALEFFKQAFDMNPRFIHESGSYAELETGEVVLAFASEDLAKQSLPVGFLSLNPKEKPQATEITLTTDDVEAAYVSALRAGAKSLVAPESKPWGQIVSYVQSPQGILIGIGSEIA